MATLTADWPAMAAETSSGLNIKSYFVDNINLARESARRELGENALLLRSRDAAPESREQGRFEVVFAVGPLEETAPPMTTEHVADAGPSAPDVQTATDAVRESSASEGLGRLLMAANLSRLLVLSPRLYPLFVQMVSRGFEHTEACALAVEVQRSGLLGVGGSQLRVPDAVEGKSEAAIESLLLRILRDKLVCDARVGNAGGGRQTILLVGPPGAGKTTSLVKLAIREGLARGRSVRLLSTDVDRVGGGRLLHSYAETLGVGFQACRSTGQLAKALDGGSRTDLTFIDTAGYSSFDIDAAADLARFARERQDIDAHLVLPASARQVDLLQIARRFEVFRPAKLLFTKLDESRFLTSLYGAAAGTEKPISFLTAGPVVPEDIEPATTDRVTDLVWGGSIERAAVAA
jgi:flagellar biosynthesis protein FlhF